ncbi:hypothetical protein ACFHW2_26020 [Actinomadura sp. LOL_016]|uniref:hypothetical protein n=1 Tax=unclassified Actinomadura TaxID=2626254 RepID=UPI003A8134E7
MNTPLAAIAVERLTWFPLVRRPRPPALPLHTRISALRDLAQAADGDLVRAAETLNKAALIASDCGLPDLARSLCWRQYDIFDRARPLPASAANLAVQPILNIVRQLIRDGDTDRAHTLLQSLHRAARDQTDVVIDGRTVRLHGLVRAALDEHQTVGALVWAALLADGTRALTTGGRWREAAEFTRAHRGVGLRLLDGRQAAILALLHDGDHDHATAMVEQSTIIEPWEHLVQSLLRVLCSRPAPPNRPRPHVPAMLAEAGAVPDKPDPWSAVFYTRIGLLALDLAGDDLEHPEAHLNAVITTASADAHAARDALAHPTVRSHPDGQQLSKLTQIVHASGLGIGTIPEPLRRNLMQAASTAAAHLYATLNDTTCAPKGTIRNG